MKIRQLWKKIGKLKNFFMEGQKSEPTRNKPTNPDNRQLGWIASLLSPFSISPYLCAYLFAYCSRIGAQRPLRTYTSPYLPPPILERENLGSLSSIFFWNFFLKFFFCRISQGSFLWLWVFLRECIFELSILMEKDSFF